MNKPADSLPTHTTLARSAVSAGSTPADTGAPVLPVSAEEAAFVSLMAGVKARLAAQPKVRVVRGGHRGELGRIDGPALAGGYTVVTETGARLGLTERDFERLNVAALAAVRGA